MVRRKRVPYLVTVAFVPILGSDRKVKMETSDHFVKHSDIMDSRFMDRNTQKVTYT